MSSVKDWDEKCLSMWKEDVIDPAVVDFVTKFAQFRLGTTCKAMGRVDAVYAACVRRRATRRRFRTSSRPTRSSSRTAGGR